MIDGITYKPEAGQFTDIEKFREPEESDSSIDRILISDSGISVSDIRLGLYEWATIEIFIKKITGLKTRSLGLLVALR